MSSATTDSAARVHAAIGLFAEGFLRDSAVIADVLWTWFCQPWHSGLMDVSESELGETRERVETKRRATDVETRRNTFRKLIQAEENISRGAARRHKTADEKFWGWVESRNASNDSFAGVNQRLPPLAEGLLDVVPTNTNVEDVCRIVANNALRAFSIASSLADETAESGGSGEIEKTESVLEELNEAQSAVMAFQHLVQPHYVADTYNHNPSAVLHFYDKSVVMHISALESGISRFDVVSDNNGLLFLRLFKPAFLAVPLSIMRQSTDAMTRGLFKQLFQSAVFSETSGGGGGGDGNALTSTAQRALWVDSRYSSAAKATELRGFRHVNLLAAAYDKQTWQFVYLYLLADTMSKTLNETDFYVFREWFFQAATLIVIANGSRRDVHLDCLAANPRFPDGTGSIQTVLLETTRDLGETWQRCHSTGTPFIVSILSHAIEPSGVLPFSLFNSCHAEASVSEFTYSRALSAMDHQWEVERRAGHKLQDNRYIWDRVAKILLESVTFYVDSKLRSA